jgi:hypothetical protein
MSHSPSRGQIHRYHVMLRTIADRRKAVADALERAKCAPIIRAFNAELAEGRLPRFSPSIRTAIAAGMPVLKFYCPACTVVGTVDLRELDQHHETPVIGLIPKFSCKRCAPNAPFAKLLALGTNELLTPRAQWSERA